MQLQRSKNGSHSPFSSQPSQEALSAQAGQVQSLSIGGVASGAEQPSGLQPLHTHATSSPAVQEAST